MGTVGAQIQVENIYRLESLEGRLHPPTLGVEGNEIARINEIVRIDSPKTN